MVSDWCRRTGISRSKPFIPLSYAAMVGGICILIGTSTNLVVNALMIDARRGDPAMPVMTMFTITAVGVPVAVAGSRWRSPSRTPGRRRPGYTSCRPA